MEKKVLQSPRELNVAQKRAGPRARTAFQPSIWGWALSRVSRACTYSDLDFLPLWHLLFNGTLVFLLYFPEGSPCCIARLCEMGQGTRPHSTPLSQAQNLPERCVKTKLH